MLEEIIKEVKEKQKEIAKLKKELLKKSEEAFLVGSKKILESCPELKSVSWTQYTPYFNDGDETIFSANTSYLTINGDENPRYLNPTIIQNHGTWDREKKVYVGRVEVPNPDYNKPLAEAVDKMSEFLGVFDNDFYKSQFGDHIQVTITENGVETEWYEHD